MSLLRRWTLQSVLVSLLRRLAPCRTLLAACGRWHLMGLLSLQKRLLLLLLGPVMLRPLLLTVAMLSMVRVPVILVLLVPA